MPRETTKVDIFVGGQISKYRHALGLSAQNLAEQVGISHQQLQKYEHGVNKISIGRLVKISNALEVPIMMLIEGSSFKEEDVFFDDGSVRRRINLEMMRYFSKLPMNKQKSIIKLIKLIAEDIEREAKAMKEVKKKVILSFKDAILKIQEDPKWKERSAQEVMDELEKMTSGKNGE